MAATMHESALTDIHAGATPENSYFESEASGNEARPALRLWVADSTGEVLAYDPTNILPQEKPVECTAEQSPDEPAERIRRTSRRESPHVYRRRRAGAAVVAALLCAIPSSVLLSRSGSATTEQRIAAMGQAAEQEVDDTTEQAPPVTINFQQIIKDIPNHLPSQASVAAQEPSLQTRRTPSTSATALPERRAASTSQASIEAIGDIGPASAQEVQDVFAHLTSNTHNITPRAAAYLLGNFIWEGGGLDPEAYNPAEHAFGLIQAQKGRENGMPMYDVLAQIDWLLDIEAPRDGLSPNLKAILTSPESSDIEIRQAIFKWIRWGEPGQRWAYAAQILAAVNS
jgi:hypothetical protein